MSNVAFTLRCEAEEAHAEGKMSAAFRVDDILALLILLEDNARKAAALDWLEAQRGSWRITGEIGDWRIQCRPEPFVDVMATTLLAAIEVAQAQEEDK